MEESTCGIPAEQTEGPAAQNTGDEAEQEAEETKQKDKSRRRLRCRMCIPVCIKVEATYFEKHKGRLYDRLADDLGIGRREGERGRDESMKVVKAPADATWLRSDEGQEWLMKQKEKLLGAAARLDELAQVVDSPLRQKGQGSDQAQANSPQRQEGPGSGQAQAEETMGRSRTHDVELDSDGRRKAEAKQVVMQALAWAAQLSAHSVST